MIMDALGDNPALIGRYFSTSPSDLATFHLKDAIFLFRFSSMIKGRMDSLKLMNLSGGEGLKRPYELFQIYRTTDESAQAIFSAQGDTSMEFQKSYFWP